MGPSDQRGEAGRPEKKVVPGPQYDLSLVRRLASKSNIHRRKARDRVQWFLDCSEREAEAYIREELAKLEPQQYVETWEMSADWSPPGIFLDIYLFANDDTCWYVKFGIYDDRIEVVSFHKEGEHE
jgi:hypothetical protein